jgi:hypothetical protein
VTTVTVTRVTEVTQLLLSILSAPRLQRAMGVPSSTVAERLAALTPAPSPGPVTLDA